MTIVEEILSSVGRKRNPYVTAALDEALKDAGGYANGIGGNELTRICKIPVRNPVHEDQVDALSELFVDGYAFEGGFRLFRDQLDAILEYDETGGLLAQIKVGGGKTIICVLIASMAFQKGKEKILLLVPSSVYLQLMRTDLPFIRPRMPLACRFYGLGNKSPATRAMQVQAGPGCYVMTYGLLSQPDARDILEAISPDLVIADEAQNLKRRTSARTKRLLDYLDDRPLCEFVAMSGTLTDKSIMDYSHLARYALKQGSPLPLGSNQVAEWSGVLDASAMPSPATAQKLAPLRLWATNHTGERIQPDADGYRMAYQARLESAPGVVLSGQDELGTSLIFRNMKPEKHNEVAKALIKQLNEEWVTPNGDEISHAINLYKWRHEMSAGFYNEMVWPTPEQLDGLPLEKAKDVLHRAKVQHEASNDYNRVLRNWLDGTSIPNLDTPMLVANNILHGGTQVPQYIREAYKLQASLVFDGMPERLRFPVRIDDFKINAAVEWAKKQKGQGALVWCYHIEMFKWLVEALEDADLDPVACDAGPQGTLKILNPENEDRIVVARVKSHGVGKNLQAFQRQLIVQWPRPATDAEQLVGRTHRYGQKADELFVDTMCWTEFDQMILAACLNDALYAQLTMKVPQKILSGTYDPPPIVFASRLLQAQGFQNKTLQAGALESRFGGSVV